MVPVPGLGGLAPVAGRLLPQQAKARSSESGFQAPKVRLGAGFWATQGFLGSGTEAQPLGYMFRRGRCLKTQVL